VTGERAALLDINVLVPLTWVAHAHHACARRWFEEHAPRGWATTPITELGFVRLSSNPSATASAATPKEAIALLEALTALPGHVFWPDDLRFVVGQGNEDLALRGHKNVTDAHLVVLARRHGGTLVTFDQRLSATKSVQVLG
jgi:hypothetical protein